MALTRGAGYQPVYSAGEPQVLPCNRIHTMRRLPRSLIVLILPALALALVSAGCAVFGVLANAAPPPTVDAKYKGLSKQTVGVMVWTDRALAIDWPSLQLNLSQSIQTRLQQEAGKKDHPKLLEGTKLVAAESVVRFQHDHPETETEAITDVAPRMNLSRLIYIEVEKFETRPAESVELYRGTLTGNLKVLEVTEGHAKVVYEEPNVSVSYPPKGPEEGSPGLGDAQTYEKTLDAFTTEIMNRFIPHSEERE